MKNITYLKPAFSIYFNRSLTVIFFIILQLKLKKFYILAFSGDHSPEIQKDESDESASEADTSELILVPGDPSAVTPMYEALNECQV